MENIEVKESVPKIETVRGVIYHKGKFLLLQKSDDSKNPNAFEFPGGKIDEKENDISTTEEQIKALENEILQETGIDITDFQKQKVEDFEIYFENKDKDGNIKKFQRIIHLFLIKINDDKEIDIKVNQTLNDEGESEDKHSGHIWCTKDELIEKITKLDEDTKKRPMAKNSRHIKKILEQIE